jgi:hypothetical protein
MPLCDTTPGDTGEGCLISAGIRRGRSPWRSALASRDASGHTGTPNCPYE